MSSVPLIPAATCVNQPQTASLSDQVPGSTDVKVSSVFRRMLSSHLARLFLATAAVITFTAVVLAGAIALPVAPVIAVGLAALGLVVALDHKKLIYEGTLIGTQLAPIAPYHHIEGTHILLGRIPLKNRDDHLRLIREENLRHVLSTVEPFEFSTLGLTSEPVTQEDWAALAVNQLHLATEDYQPLSLELIRQGVEFLREAELRGEASLVHCKAGRGRSATIVACYLVKYHGMTVDQAIAHVKASRSFVNPNPGQRRAAERYAASLASK